MTRTVGILSSRTGWHVDGLRAALEARGVATAVFPITSLVASVGAPDAPLVRAEAHRLERFPLLLVRIIPAGSLEQIVFRMNALHRLEAAGVAIVNRPGAIERTVDKYLTSALLEARGLPTPPTVVTETFDEALRAVEALGGDVVVKPLFGSGGRGMVRVTDPEVAYRTFQALDLGRYVYYLQRFVPHGDHDVRAFVVGREVVAAMRRRSPGWRHNVSRGATVEAHALSPAETRLALEAVAALGLDYAGVDLLPGADGTTYVIEVNAIPGWAGLQRTTAVPIADAVAAHVAARLARPQVQDS
jgi:RimK family alpha-L-glutamate ligase